MQNQDPFSPEVVTAVMRHMNDDHAADGLIICRALGGQPAATRATMTGMDQEGASFVVAVDGHDVPVRIPWGEPITTRAQIRREVVRWYQEACASLGIDPRPAEEPGATTPSEASHA
jgi:putative heme iron utilization protein